MVARLVRDTPYWISDSYESAIDTTITLTIADNTGSIKVIVLTYGKQYVPGFARIAIVLEEFGESMPPELSDLFALVNCPINIGIVPGKPYSNKIYRSAMQGGWEVVCQLPMESVPYADLGTMGIYKTTTIENLEKLLARLSDAFEGAAGYSIHGGGVRIVENEPVILKTVFKHIKTEEKYFLDNSFAAHSRAEEFAYAQDIKCRVPGLWADRNGTFDQQKELVSRFADTVRKTGSGIVLVRNGVHSIELVRFMIAYFHKNDVKIVNVSSLFE